MAPRWGRSLHKGGSRHGYSNNSSAPAHHRYVQEGQGQRQVSALALLDDARSIGDAIHAMTKADRLDIPQSVKDAAKGKAADSEEAKALKKAIKRAEKTARDWTRQVVTAVEVFDLVAGHLKKR